MAASPGEVNDLQGSPIGIVHASPDGCGELVVLFDPESGVVMGGNVDEPLLLLGRVAAQY